MSSRPICRCATTVARGCCSFDAIGGAVLEDVAARPCMTDAGLDATHGAHPALPQSAPAEAPAPRQAACFPAPLRDYVGGDLAAVNGGRSAWACGRRSCRRRRGRHGPAAVHSRRSGACPTTATAGMELTLVLQGAFRDESDRFGPGDLEIATEDLEHTPVAEAGAGLHLPCRHRCAAAVQQADPAPGAAVVPDLRRAVRRTGATRRITGAPAVRSGRAVEGSAGRAAPARLPVHRDRPQRQQEQRAPRRQSCRRRAGR